MADERMPTVREALAKLAELGTMRKIADHLQAEGVKGHRSRMTLCPLARYLTRVTGQVVYVDNESAQLTDETAETCELPLVLVDFVERFDIGHFPELEAKERNGA